VKSGIIDFNQNIENKEHYYNFNGWNTNDKGWVPFGRLTNEFADFLIKLKDRSEMHGQIINMKAKMIAGDEVIMEDDTKEFFKNCEDYNDVEDFIYRLAYDLVLFGSFNINVVWNKIHDRINKLYHIDSSKILYGKKNKDGQIDNFYHCDNWAEYRKGKYPISIIPSFGTSTKANEIKCTIPAYSPGSNYYGKPDYYSAIKSIETDMLINDFHNNNIKNNFAIPYILTIVGDEPTQEEKEQFSRLFKEKFGGTKNSGEWLFMYAVDKDHRARIEPIPVDQLDKKFEQLSKDVNLKILEAHGVTSPVLVGVRTPGQLGGSVEFEQARDLFFTYQILPLRKKILKVINKLLAINGLSEIMIENKEHKDDKDNEEIDKIKSEQNYSKNSCSCDNSKLSYDDFFKELDEANDDDINGISEYDINLDDFINKDELVKDITEEFAQGPGKKKKKMTKMKRWKVNLSEKTCEWCKKGLNGMQVPVNAPFVISSISNGKTYRLMGPSNNHKGCKCELEYFSIPSSQVKQKIINNSKI
jgi:hypothetical protein